MASPIQEIKDRLDIVSFIRSYVELRPAGKNFKGLCPFHKEKTPSFMVSPERQTWHCFGQCAEGGDILKFLMKHENIEFYEALKILAERAGIELRRVSPADQKQFGVLFDINALAKDFFKKELASSSKAQEYLKSRGLTQETIDEFEIGLAPSGFDHASVHFFNTGFDVKDVERAGLVFKNERGRYVDRFRDRVMFPICNAFGKVIGFSGRVVPWVDVSHTGKYVNSPETPIFNKSRALYGFHKSKEHIKEAKSAVLVEGQMDFLMAYQDGVKNAVATSGTALTPDHVRTLKRFADTLVLSFDNDEAGFKAAERSIDLAYAFDMEVRVLALGEFKDPAEAAEKRPGALRELASRAIPAMQFYFDRFLTAARGDIAGIKKGVRAALSKMKVLASPIEKTYWMKELSMRTSLPEQALAEEMERLEAKKSETRDESREDERAPRVRPRREIIAERLLSLVIIRDGFRTACDASLAYLPETYRLLFHALESGAPRMSDDLADLMNTITLRASFERELLGEEHLDEEFEGLLRELRREYFKEEQDRLAQVVQQAEREGDEAEIRARLAQFDEASRLMHNS